MVNVFTRYLENHQLMGMPRAKLPQKAEELSRPCWLGERLRSALMEGSKIPMVEGSIQPAVEQVLHSTITTQAVVGGGPAIRPLAPQPLHAPAYHGETGKGSEEMAGERHI